MARTDHVASFTDAWIETLAANIVKGMTEVASFTDAWIETTEGMSTEQILESHLLQMRGLKPKIQHKLYITPQSHLLQMRGLKHKKITLIGVQQLVASFTDAWIETDMP